MKVEGTYHFGVARLDRDPRAFGVCFIRDAAKNSGAETDEAKKKTSKRRSRRGKRPITKPKFDPNAKRVELFEGMKEGQFFVPHRDPSQG